MTADLGIPDGFLPNLDDVKKPQVEGSKIVEFFKGKNIFVTGATGFLGKVLVEKLLRACEGLDTIYILVRSKRNEDESTRVDKVYDDPLFQVLKKLQPKFRHKISTIKGDISLPGLGVDPSDWKLLSDNVNVIFHIAATVKFDEKIKLAVAINIQGTKDIISLAKNCRQLDSFVYVSTAFSHATFSRTEIDEVVYDCPYKTDELIELVQNKSEQWLDENTKYIIGNFPNTYAFTKAIAESTVIEFGTGLPICIYRPAIVVATYKEPIRSWIDNFYGATGIFLGAGTGLLKTAHVNGKKKAEIVPADFVINGLIACSYKTALDKETREIPVYNYVASPENPVTWDEQLNGLSKHGLNIPTIHAIWYFSLTLNRFKYMHLLYKFFFHTTPAILVDLVMLLTGQKPFLRKVYEKVDKFSTVIAYFSTNDWKFYNRNTEKLWNSLTEADKRNFQFSMRDLDWDDFNRTHLMGLRTYLLQEDPSTLPLARKKWWRFKILHNIFKWIIYLILFRITYGIVHFLYTTLF